ncbi:MAG TPA: hypothetical protein VFG14_09780 [Chthoniobacteraceae bacterium]|nr:hypothetical protein [Chthoniobacteraceae bacterium]
MKTYYLIAMLAVGPWLGANADASIVSQTDPQAGGIGYRWTVTLGSSDSASFSRHAGAWAWEDTALFSSGQTPVGWTHNSDWVAFKLEMAGYVTLRLTNAEGIPNLGDPSGFAGNNLFPGMTIYSGWDNDLAPQSFADANNEGFPVDNWHSYVNRGNIEWAEDVQYFAHLEPNGTHSIEATFFMDAGDYTLVFGGRSPSGNPEPRQGYAATLTSSPVPEPGSALVALAGGAALLVRRRSPNKRRAS